MDARQLTAHVCRCAPAQIGLAKRLFYTGDATAAYNVPPPVASQDATSAAYKAQVCARMQSHVPGMCKPAMQSCMHVCLLAQCLWTQSTHMLCVSKSAG